MRIWFVLGMLITLAGLTAAQDTNFPVGPQYLITSGSPLFLQPIATPSLSFSSGLSQPRTSAAVAEPTPRADDATYQAVSAILDEQRQTGLLRVYYGLPQESVVAIALAERAEVGFSIPGSISETGVVEFTSAQVLGERGYGITLAEAAARWKAHQPSAHRVYTNDDVERLRHRD